MKKILFYCQHLLGIGHVTRSLAICKELAEEFETHFIQGGPSVNRSIEHDNFRHFYLHPLLIGLKSRKLYDPQRKHSLEQVWEKRKIEIDKILTSKYDFLIVELFPFGRNNFHDEIVSLIQKIKSKNPTIKVLCSIRDILIDRKDPEKRDEAYAEVINAYFDYVLVHSDPQYIKFDESFSAVDLIKDKIVYTGYVTEGKCFTNQYTGNGVLVSMGGGAISREIVEVFLPVAQLLTEYDFHFITGPYTSEDIKSRLVSMSTTHANIVLKPFTDHFESVLSQAALSVSLGGYNTVMNILNTRTRAIILPYKDTVEQGMRVGVLQKSGFLRVLESEEHDPEVCRSIVIEMMESDYTKSQIDLSGSEGTRKFIKRLCDAN